MSAYIQFFIRHENIFLPIGTFSRGNYIYQLFNDFAPWEKIRPITISDLERIRNEMVLDIEKAKDQLKEIKERRALVATFNNSVEDKLEALMGYDEYEQGVKDDLAMAEYTRGYLNTLSDILDDIQFDERYDSDTYIYVGVEVGNPTIDDIVR